MGRSGGWNIQRVKAPLRLGLVFLLLLSSTLVAQQAEDYTAARSALESTRKQGLADLIEEQRQQAQTSLEEKKRARNPTGIATYSEALALLESLARDVQEKGDFNLPANWRRALDPMVQSLKDGRAKWVDQFTADLAALDARFPPEQRVAATPPPEPAPAPADAEAAVTEPETNEAPVAATLNLTMKQAPPPSSDPDIFAQRGEGTLWRPIGRWTASMRSEGLLELQLFNQAGTAQGAYTNPVTREISPWRYVASEILPPGPYPIRLRRLNNHSVVDVDNWPGEGKAGPNLVVRTRRGKWPVLHGFDVEVAGESATGPEGSIPVPVTSDPPGAQVLVNGAPFRIDGVPVLTPCRVPLPPGAAVEIRLRLAGAKEAVAPNFRVQPGARVYWRFERTASAPSTFIQVDPRREWAPTKVVLKPDQRARFTVEGSWQVGAKRESCTYRGYAAESFPHYYANPTPPVVAIDTYPYGALLYRIGERGPVRMVNPDEPAETIMGGTLYFDVNEQPGRKFRDDNRGLINVRVSVDSGPSR